MAGCSCKELLTAQTVDATSAAETSVDLEVGRLQTVWVTGTFDGATIRIEVSNLNNPGLTDWLPARAAFAPHSTEAEFVADTSMTFTQPGWRSLQIKASKIRAIQTGSGPSTQITVALL